MSVELAAFAKKKMTPDEAALLQELTKPGAKIEVAVSGDVSLKDWNKTTSVVCRGLLRAQLQEQALLPVLGRLLVIARDNTDIWSGYASFKQFLTDHVRKEFGIGTSSAYYAMQMADRLPHLKISQVEGGREETLRGQDSGEGQHRNGEGTARVLRDADQHPAQRHGRRVREDWLQPGKEVAHRDVPLQPGLPVLLWHGQPGRHADPSDRRGHNGMDHSKHRGGT